LSHRRYHLASKNETYFFKAISQSASDKLRGLDFSHSIYRIPVNRKPLQTALHNKNFETTALELRSRQIKLKIF